MIRRAFTMRLKPGALAEYTRNHNEIWPELVEEIERSGIATITTFEQDPVLFLFSEITDEFLLKLVQKRACKKFATHTQTKSSRS